MLDGEPVVLISYSGRFQAQLAAPVAERLRRHGLRPILVGEEPLPAGVDSNPNAKVSYFFDHADMVVYLATPDDRLQSGEIHTRQNIIDEHRTGLERGHLKHKLLVFKAPEVTLPSNINPVFDQLPLDDPEWIVERVLKQAAVWGVLPKTPVTPGEPRSPQSSGGAHQDPVVAADRQEGAGVDQAGTAAEALRFALRGGEVNLDELRRAQLAVAGVLAEQGLSDTLGVHFVNQLFARRHSLNLRPPERTLLLRTYLHYASDDNVPGCAWFRAWRRAELLELLCSFAAGDADVAVRTKALALLRELKYAPPLEELESLLAPMLGSDEFRLRWAAIEFLVARADPETLGLLDDQRLEERDPHKTASARLQILAASDPDAALRLYAEMPYARDDESKRALERRARRLTARILEDALASNEEDCGFWGSGWRGAVGASRRSSGGAWPATTAQPACGTPRWAP